MKKIIKWLDNYWYHYKWPTVIVGFLAVVITVMLVQYLGREQYDISIIYAGPMDPNPNQTLSIESELGKLVTVDFNGDGKRNCQINDFFLLTDKQYEEKEKEYDAKGEFFYASAQELSNSRQQFTNQVFAGEAVICLLDPAWYKLLLEQQAFVPLNEVLEEVPEYALDEYSVRLCDTAFAEYFTSMKAFPEDTVLCIRTLSTTTAFKNKKNAEKKYEYNKKFFVSLFDFSVVN